VTYRLSALITAFLLLPAAASGQESDPAVEFGEVWRHEGELRFSVTATGLFDEEAQRTIGQGGTAAIDYTFELYRRRVGWFDTQVHRFDIPFRITFDAYDRNYRLLGIDIRLKTESFDEIVKQCTELDGVLVGSIEELGLDMDATYYLVVRVNYKPMTVETIEEIRDWMSRPGGQPPNQDQSGRTSSGVGTRIARALMSAAGFGEEELQGESGRFKPADLPEK
jgi:hypothetical protein